MALYHDTCDKIHLGALAQLLASTLPSPVWLLVGWSFQKYQKWAKKSLKIRCLSYSILFPHQQTNNSFKPTLPNKFNSLYLSFECACFLGQLTSLPRCRRFRLLRWISFPFSDGLFSPKLFMDPPKASGDTSSTITGCTAETLGFFQKPNFPKSLGEKSSYPICVA